MLSWLYCFLALFAVSSAASPPGRSKRSLIPIPIPWISSVYQELFLWNPDYNTTLSPLNGTCHLECDTLQQTFKNCTSLAGISQCLCTNDIGDAISACVSCIAAVTDSQLLNFTAQLGVQNWYSGCKIEGHNVSQPQVNATAGLALAANAEFKNISLRPLALGILGAILGSLTMLTA
ncbi:hypothetical protein DFH06DRAFT_1149340 [Mycena polygramma]|nr:hypothetical protein DFH06DRAFT_1149340 [Mycena polygramma]